MNNKNWIFSKKQDAFWVIGSCMAGFLIIGLYYLLKSFEVGENYSILIIYLIWAILFDGTHAFATYTRTYFDKEFYSKNKRVLKKSFYVFLVGPIFILYNYLLSKDINQTSIAFIVFNRFAICYAYYHLIRQHWGFVVIYRKKNNENDLKTKLLDNVLLLSGTFFPFLYHQSRDIQKIHLSESILIEIGEWKTFNVCLFITGWVLFVLYNITIKKKYYDLKIISIVMVISSIIIYILLYTGLRQGLHLFSLFALTLFLTALIRYVYLWLRKGLKISNNYPKWIFLFTVIVTYNIILYIKVPILILIASVTIFHNIQYHKIINYHNKKKYFNYSKHGISVLLTQKLSLLVVFSIIFSLCIYIPRIASNVIVGHLLINYLLSGFFWGVALHHYYLDSIIWRISGNNNKDSWIRNFI